MLLYLASVYQIERPQEFEYLVDKEKHRCKRAAHLVADRRRETLSLLCLLILLIVQKIDHSRVDLSRDITNEDGDRRFALVKLTFDFDAEEVSFSEYG